ncbi:hypothetical protein [Vibrio parahaemolyticus]
MNWKISKIEVSSFKAFKHIYLDLGESALLTLDGPNGYGKQAYSTPSNYCLPVRLVEYKIYSLLY